jgi:hypothetical protein
MRKNISGIIVSTYALERTPYTGKSGKEAQQAGMGRVASRRVAPFVAVEAKEQFDILVY